MTRQITDLYVDFLCPYAWRGVELAAAMRGQGEALRLRCYSLVEGNHPENAKSLSWRLTDQPLDAEGGEGYLSHQRPSLNAFLAALAAAEQGEDYTWKFTLALFRAHHEDKKPLDDATFQQAAEEAGLDLSAWAQARRDETGLRARLRADLDAAAEARHWWDLFRTVLHSEAGIATIKRAKNRPATRR